MKTVVVQIGNSDNKLTQSEWADFVADMKLVVERYAHQVHFFGGAETWAP